MKRNRCAKIVATLGPATSSPVRIRELFEAGADVFRLNFSHGSHDDHRLRFDIIRKIESDLGRPIAILLDLQGPKIRVGKFSGGHAKLIAGTPFRLDCLDEPGNSRRAPLHHPEVFKSLEPGMRLLLDDGKLRLRAEKCGPDFVETLVVTGGELSDRKGLNLPDAVLPMSPLTDKDRQDLAFGLELGVDWVALSFVQRPEDVAELHSLVKGRAGVLSKLEKPSAIQYLKGILEHSDAVMVARGDLGVEVPPEDVPALQKRIIRACRRAGKPVVVATQMLDSMVHSPTPTRAEASDVATAIYDSADAVMLSAETATGEYPIEAVAMMDRIIHRVERDGLYQKMLDAERLPPEHTTGDAITAAAQQCAHTVSAAAIVTFTSSGSTSYRAARERPNVRILGLTPEVRTARRLALAWGVHSVHTQDVRSVSDMVERALEIAKREEFATPGDRLVITAGVPFGSPGATNMLRIVQVE